MVRKRIMNWGRGCWSSSSAWWGTMLLVLWAKLSFAFKVILWPFKSTCLQPFLLNCSASSQGVQAVRPTGFRVVHVPPLEKGPKCGQEVWFIRALPICQGRSWRMLFVWSAANSYKVSFEQIQPGLNFKAGNKITKWPNFYPLWIFGESA